MDQKWRGLFERWINKIKGDVDVDIGAVLDYVDPSLTLGENFQILKKVLREKYGIVSTAEAERELKKSVEKEMEQEKQWFQDVLEQYADVYPDIVSKYAGREPTPEEIDSDIELELEILRGKVKSLEEQLEAERKKAVPPEEVAIRVVKDEIKSVREEVKKEVEKLGESQDKKLKELSTALANALRDLAEGISGRFSEVEKAIEKSERGPSIVVSPPTPTVDTEPVEVIDPHCINREMKAIFKERYGVDIEEWREKIRTLGREEKEKADAIELEVYNLAVEICKEKKLFKINPQLRGALCQLVYFDTKRNEWRYLFPRSESFWNPALWAENYPACMTPSFILFRAISKGIIDISDCLEVGIPESTVRSMLKEGRKIAEKYGFVDLL